MHLAHASADTAFAGCCVPKVRWTDRRGPPALLVKGLDMRTLPRDLAGRMADAGQEVVKLPLEAARRKASEIIDRRSRDGLISIVENWRQLPDGQIEFTVRHFRSEY
jgi:hypothetical protein